LRRWPRSASRLGSQHFAARAGAEKFPTILKGRACCGRRPSALRPKRLLLAASFQRHNSEIATFSRENLIVAQPLLMKVRDELRAIFEIETGGGRRLTDYAYPVAKNRREHRD
jgi:hypothetical protein